MPQRSLDFAEAEQNWGEKREHASLPNSVCLECQIWAHAWKPLRVGGGQKGPEWVPRHLPLDIEPWQEKTVRGTGMKNKSGPQVYACFSSATSLLNQLGQFHTFKTRTKKPKSGRLNSPTLWIYCLFFYFSCFRELGIIRHAEHWQMFSWLLHKCCQPDNFYSVHFWQEKKFFCHADLLSSHAEIAQLQESVCVCMCMCWISPLPCMH